MNTLSVGWMAGGLSLSLSLPFFYSKDRFPLRGWLLLDLGSHTVTEQDDAVKFELKTSQTSNT